eukprot:TRINITY_DN112596_c0_g1_i1.p1 TRINITY_DN112596_c0_g1~~TRINITY_DN112596_c0_g1_i1.p1  ORF type:complete len:268 (+),score=92.47 TRINITY_DN112596_c0_g1_i1:31-804(+)
MMARRRLSRSHSCVLAVLVVLAMCVDVGVVATADNRNIDDLLAKINDKVDQIQNKVTNKVDHVANRITQGVDHVAGKVNNFVDKVHTTVDNVHNKVQAGVQNVHDLFGLKGTAWNPTPPKPKASPSSSAGGAATVVPVAGGASASPEEESSEESSEFVPKTPFDSNGILRAAESRVTIEKIQLPRYPLLPKYEKFSPGQPRKTVTFGDAYGHEYKPHHQDHPHDFPPNLKRTGHHARGGIFLHTDAQGLDNGPQGFA